MGVGEHKIVENYFGLKYSFGFFINYINITFVHSEAYLGGKFNENKHLAEF